VDDNKGDIERICTIVRPSFDLHQNRPFKATKSVVITLHNYNELIDKIV
jgi:hypothetical protein